MKFALVAALALIGSAQSALASTQTLSECESAAVKKTLWYIGNFTQAQVTITDVRTVGTKVYLSADAPEFFKRDSNPGGRVDFEVTVQPSAEGCKATDLNAIEYGN